MESDDDQNADEDADEHEYNDGYEYAYEDEYEDEYEYEDEWEPDGMGPGLVIRDDEDLATYAACLWGTCHDEEFLLWLVPLGPGSTVLPGGLAVHDLPGHPEPIDRPGVASFLEAVVLTGPAVDIVTAVAVVIWLPADGDDGAAARAWARLVRGAAAEAGVPLTGIVAVSDSGRVSILQRTRSGQPR